MSEILLASATIARDEVDNIPDLAASLSHIPLRVLLDTGSADGTPDLARELGFTVYHAPWPGSFAAARNAVWDLTDASWVLTIDCDERLVQQHPTALADACKAAGDQVSLMLDIVEPTDPLHQPDLLEVFPSARLFRPEGLRWFGRLHETVCHADGTPLSHSTKLSSAHLWHRGYSPDVVDMQKKNERNLSLARAQFDLDENVSLFKRHLDLGRTLLSAGLRQQARDHLSAAMKLSNKQENLSALQARWALVSALLSDGEDVSALELAVAGDGVILALGAMAAVRTGQLNQARELIERAYATPILMPHDPILFSLRLPLLRAQLYLVAGDRVQAIDELIALNERFPGHPDIANLTSLITSS